MAGVYAIIARRFRYSEYADMLSFDIHRRKNKHVWQMRALQLRQFKNIKRNNAAPNGSGGIAVREGGV